MKTVFLLAIISTTMEMVVCLICARQLGRLRHETGDNSRRLLALGCPANQLAVARPRPNRGSDWNMWANVREGALLKLARLRDVPAGAV